MEEDECFSSDADRDDDDDDIKWEGSGALTLLPSDAALLDLPMLDVECLWAKND